MKHIQVIIGSVRAARVADQIAQWVIDAVSSAPGMTFEPIDLRDWHLPMDDEPYQPKRRDQPGYLQPHTRAFSAKISEADGFVFLTPQYNWGYPAALKNALDHLYDEWSGKPAVIVSYGNRGGVKAAAQLKEVFDGLHMRTAPTMPALFVKEEMLDADGRIADPDGVFGPHRETLLQAVAELDFEYYEA